MMNDYLHDEDDSDTDIDEVSVNQDHMLFIQFRKKMYNIISMGGLTGSRA